MLKVERLRSDRTGASGFLLGDESSKDAVLIDPGVEGQAVDEVLKRRAWKLRAVFLTSGQLDQAARAGEIRAKYSVPLYAHKNELGHLQRLPVEGEKHGLCGVKSPVVDRFLQDQAEIQCGSIRVRCVETPGHAEGSISFAIGSHLFPELSHLSISSKKARR